MKTWIKYLIVHMLFILGGILFYFKVYIPKSTFETVHPSMGKLEIHVFGIGNVSAKNIYPVGAQSGGKILTILRDEGEWVKKGDLVATIDPVDLPLQLEEAKATKDKARYESAAIKEEMLSLEAQKTLARITYERYEKLYEQGYAAQVEYDKAKSDLESITAQIAATQARIDSSEAEIIRIGKSIEALQERLLRLSIYAPIDGYIISKDAQVAQNVLPSQPIVQMVDSKTVWVKAYVDERISGKIKIDQPVSITLRSRSKEPLQGYVARISAVSDAVTQEREINILFNELPIPFYINEQAEVSITTQNIESILKVPLTLLCQENGKTGVWIMKEEQANFVPLDIAVRGEAYAGIASGLDEQTKIIVPNSHKKPLSEGMRIH